MNQWTIWKLRHLWGHEPCVHVRGATRWIFQGNKHSYTSWVWSRVWQNVAFCNLEELVGPILGRKIFDKPKSLWIHRSFVVGMEQFSTAEVHGDHPARNTLAVRSLRGSGFTNWLLVRIPARWSIGCNITWFAKLKHPWRKYFCITVMHILAVKSCQRACFIGESESLWFEVFPTRVLSLFSHRTTHEMDLGYHQSENAPKCFDSEAFTM